MLFIPYSVIVFIVGLYMYIESTSSPLGGNVYINSMLFCYFVEIRYSSLFVLSLCIFLCYSMLCLY